MFTVKSYNFGNNKNLTFGSYRQLDPSVRIAVSEGEEREAVMQKIAEEYESVFRPNLIDGITISRLPAFFAARIQSFIKQIIPSSNIQVNPKEIEKDAKETRKILDLVA
ncbi:MAG: hypothetical protein V2B14_04840 [bacterium]